MSVPPARPGWLRAFAAAWTVFCVGVLGLLAGEVWMALAEARVRRAAEAYRQLHRSVYDARATAEAGDIRLWRSPGEQFVAYRPGASLTMAVGGEVVRVDINSRGFRTREFAVPRPRGLIRIACIGGSTTVQGPSNDETYPALLEKALRRRHGPQVEVLNLGISGVTSDNWLKRSGELFALEPDVVLQYEGVNDIAWSALPGYSFAHPWRRRLRAARCLRPLVPVREADVAAALDQAVANQEQLELLCAARGVRHVAATFAAPDASSAAPGLRALLDDDVRTVWGRQANLAAFADYERLLDAYNRRVSAAAGRGSLVIADVHRALRDPRLFVDACHLTPEGIGILASVFEKAVDADVAALTARR